MAEELQFASRTDAKRKYEDQTPPPPSTGPRRPTGFSAPITADTPPPSYNNVPPPADEIQLAKQKAQEIAARIWSNAEAKRPRLENGDDDNKGFSSGPNDLGQKFSGQPMSQVGMTPPSSIPVSYGFPGSSKKIDIPNGRVGVIIGKGGETIKYLQLQSGAKIQVTRDMDVDPNSQTRLVELVGTQEQISKAEELITEVLSEAESGGSGVVSRRYTGQPGGEQFSMKVPNNKVGLIIGKGGETIKNMQNRSGARIQLIPLHLPPGDTSTERTVYIDGTTQQIESAKQLVNEVISENRPRNSGMGGGYQQGYRPPQSQTNWGPPVPPVQQPGYGYTQPGGAYTGAAPQYNMPQPPYSGYPPQSTTGWDQTQAPSSQQTTQTGGYDYYSQQPSQQQPTPGGSTTPTDNSGYNYGQPPASNYNQQQGSYAGTNYSQPPTGQQQAYSQDAYGGYQAPAPQSGYGQPQTNVTQGYDQSQGYNSAPTYGSGASAAAPDGAAPAYGAQAPTQVPPVQPPVAAPHGYSAQPSNTTPSYPGHVTQPTYPQTSQPAYGTPPVAQTGYGQSAPLTQTSYGQPQGQKPPPAQVAYGQAQPPSSQAGYVQPGYSHSQTTPTHSSSGQADSGHRPPSTGYGQAAAPQTGYVQPTYGVAPATQPAYGVQQQQPYGDSYAGGYSQPPVYSNDGAVSGNTTHGTYDAAAPGAQPVQPSAVPKASPQS